MADDPPKLKLAAEADPIELEKQQALRELAWAVREMTANILRIIRGAGRPALLPQQIINLSDGILETHKSARAWAIWSAMEDTLQSGVPHSADEPGADAYESTIAKGALQLVASRLLHQRAQEAAGGREIGEGIEEAERLRESRRRRWDAEEADAAMIRAKRVLSRPLQQPAKPRKVKPKPPRTAPAPKAAPSSSADAEEPADRPTSTAQFMKARTRQLRGDEEA